MIDWRHKLDFTNIYAGPQIYVYILFNIYIQFTNIGFIVAGSYEFHFICMTTHLSLRPTLQPPVLLISENLVFKFA